MNGYVPGKKNTTGIPAVVAQVHKKRFFAKYRSEISRPSKEDVIVYSVRQVNRRYKNNIGHMVNTCGSTVICQGILYTIPC